MMKSFKREQTCEIVHASCLNVNGTMAVMELAIEKQDFNKAVAATIFVDVFFLSL